MYLINCVCVFERLFISLWLYMDCVYSNTLSVWSVLFIYFSFFCFIFISLLLNHQTNLFGIVSCLASLKYLIHLHKLSILHYIVRSISFHLRSRFFFSFIFCFPQRGLFINVWPNRNRAMCLIWHNVAEMRWIFSLYSFIGTLSTAAHRFVLFLLSFLWTHTHTHTGDTHRQFN